MDNYDPLLLKNQLCFPLYAASKALIRKYDPFLKPLGLTYTQYIVMLAMWEKKKCDVKELGEAVCLDSGTLSPLLDKLIGKGLLSKTRLSDGRFREIALTEKGAALREDAKGIPTSVGCCLGLSEEEMKELYRLTYKTLENLK